MTESAADQPQENSKKYSFLRKAFSLAAASFFGAAAAITYVETLPDKPPPPPEYYTSAVSNDLRKAADLLLAQQKQADLNKALLAHQQQALSENRGLIQEQKNEATTNKSLLAFQKKLLETNNVFIRQQQLIALHRLMMETQVVAKAQAPSEAEQIETMLTSVFNRLTAPEIEKAKAANVQFVPATTSMLHSHYNVDLVYDDKGAYVVLNPLWSKEHNGTAAVLLLQEFAKKTKPPLEPPFKKRGLYSVTCTTYWRDYGTISDPKLQALERGETAAEYSRLALVPNIKLYKLPSQQ